MTWQPIETAPKDGTQIMASNGIWIWLVTWDEKEHQDVWAGWRYESGINPNGENYNSGLNSEGILTHWQPLPQPPTQ